MLVVCRLAGLSTLILDYAGGLAVAQPVGAGGREACGLGDTARQCTGRQRRMQITIS
jgi:hypothetical protein